MAKLKITDADSAIKEKINTALAKAINKSLSKTVNTVERNVKSVIRNALLNSPAIYSLSSGALKAEFGLTSDPTGAIVESILSTMSLKTMRVNNQLKGGFTLVMQPSNFSNLLSLSVATQPVESGGSIPWLEWLLTLGDSVIIADFGVEFGGGKGRTGEARMNPEYAPYKVNSRFSGTPDDNFITKAVASVSDQIRTIILKAI